MFTILLLANFLTIVVGGTLLLVGALAMIFRRMVLGDAARLAIWGGAIVLIGGIAFLLLFQYGYYCIAGCG